MNTLWNTDNLIIRLDEFLDLYKTRPINNNTGGSLSVNHFYTWITLKYIQPKYVIESGVFQGLGTWLIDKTLPESKIVCIEPAMQQIRYRSKNATYLYQDFLTFTNENISQEKANNTLIYFDDHQNQFDRILHAKKLGFKHILLDDNYPEYCGRRHVSIQACLNNKSDPGFNLPINAKDILQNIIDIHYIFPPIFKWPEPVSMEKSFIEVNALLNEFDTQYEIFYNDMHNYRWSTYIKLKD